MKWSEIFLTLANEEVVQISYEAVLRAKLSCIIGDIPIYKIETKYFDDGPDGGLKTVTVDTFEQLLDLIEREPAFRKCDECGDLITGGFFSDIERNKEYCCLACLVKDMNRIHGKDKWKFNENRDKLNRAKSDLNGDHFLISVLENIEKDGAVTSEWRPYHLEYSPPINDEDVEDDFTFDEEGFDLIDSEEPDCFDMEDIEVEEPPFE